MIAGPDSTAPTMKNALTHSISALAAAVEIDVDRTDDDRAFFTAQKAILDALYIDVRNGSQALEDHTLLNARRLQAFIELGDVVLDRGVRKGKARMKLELKELGDADGADQVFPADIDEIVDAERRVEPNLVLQILPRFSKVADFPGKADIAADLEGRANTQNKSFTDRDAGAVVEAGLEATLDKAVIAGSDALYKLEKLLLVRFPREKRYVRAFFLDVAPERKKPAAKSAANPPAGDK